ncbi:MAG: homoaconitate hydratase [Clostridiales bacterium]|nr:homoaconitate hydratase [Clostridiales bacterium]
MIKSDKKIAIMDNTLREGEQTAGVAFSKEEKIDIALKLDQAGVDYIEAGFPAVSEQEFNIIKKVNSLGIKAKIMALARTSKADVDLVYEAGCHGVTFFIPTSEILLKAKSNMSGIEPQKLIESSIEAVDYAKRRNLYVAFGAEDSTRTDFEFILRMYKAVIDAGADIVAVVDTVSRLTPVDTYNMVKEMKERLGGAPISTHLHNDFGMATANTVSAVMAGADQIQTTINGLGERAGSPSLQECVMAVKELTEYDFNHINTHIFKELSNMIIKYSGVNFSPLMPIVGENAFSHESGLHASAVLNDPKSYEPFSPDLVGTQTKFIIGKHTGKNIVKHILEKTFHIDEISQEMLQSVVKEVKEKGSSARLNYDDVFKIYSDIKRRNENV